MLCRWDLVAPEDSESGAYEIIVAATQEIRAGEDLWLCYESRPGSYFLLHYGFV